jgi:hypothetical protein
MIIQSAHNMKKIDPPYTVKTITLHMSANLIIYIFTYLFYYKLFIHKLFIHKLFIYKLFIYKLFIYKLFINKVFIYLLLSKE